jgi:hypothetical protein
MPVEFRLHGLLANGRGEVHILPFDKNENLIDLLAQLDVVPGEYSLLVRDGTRVNGKTVPQDGDAIDVYPFLGGG